MSLAETGVAELPQNNRSLRLGTLVGLRWLAIAGQTIGLLFVSFGLGYPLPLFECLGLVAMSVLLNLWVVFRLGEGYRPSAAAATAQLAWDLCQLASLLALTGGLENPFSLLLLAAVSVSATSLPRTSTLIIATLAVILASLLAVFHLGLPWDPDARIIFDRVYVIGIWVSIVCGVTFIAAYTNKVAHEARQLADALAATELALSRREQLTALDGLAAAAAHELGTPLSTIALAAREMHDELPEGPLREDVELIMSQAARCRDILATLRSHHDTPGDPFAAVAVSELLAELVQPHDAGDGLIDIRTEGAPEAEPVVQRSVGLLYGLGNLVENAAQFAKDKVEIVASWEKGRLTITITDDGPGFAPELLTRLGEPYLTTRARGDSTEPGGLGLGIFIAKTLLERTGAKLSFANATTAGRHAQVTMVWPRDMIDQGLAP